MQYDYLIVGAGLFGSVFAYEMKKKGRKCLVIDKRDHLAGNIYTKEVLGIQVHEYGAHIFHTSDREVWNYIRRFAEFNNFINSPVAIYGEELYNLPFNMNTFHALWGVKTPAQARDKIESQVRELKFGQPRNLEEQALSLAGRDVYEKLIKGYTEKQWGRKCTELPAFIIRRVPFRFTYDNNYFNDTYQGIPVGGYTQIVEKMLDGVEVRLGTDFKAFTKGNPHRAGEDTFARVLYTGRIDEYYEHRLGTLEYRSLRFEQEILADCDNYQGNAVVNYTESEVPYTRIIEHKHFERDTGEGTVITREYPAVWRPGNDPYYPVNDEKNNALFEKYRKLSAADPTVIFGGRLGHYLYYDMDKVIRAALELVKKEEEGAA